MQYFIDLSITQRGLDMDLHKIFQHKNLLILVLFLLLLPLFMWCFWTITPHKDLNMITIDKTSMTQEGLERKSLYWILHYKKYTNFGNLPSLIDGHYGFLPRDCGNYAIRDLDNLDEQEIENLADVNNLMFVLDTYGVYKSNWFKDFHLPARDNLIYGGLNQGDLDLIDAMHRRNKTVILEFNSIVPPTSSFIRQKIENKYNFEWTGWQGRFVTSLDTNDTQLSPDLIELYKKRHTGSWPFHNSGIVLINKNNDMVVLETGRTLARPSPIIETGKYGRKVYDLPQKIHYPFWFNIVKSDTSNRTVANFKIYPTHTGRCLLEKYGIPRSFPAIIQNTRPPYFYYMAGDFSDNPAKNMVTSHFKGIALFRKSFYGEDNISSRKSFLWKFYYPFMTNLLRIEYKYSKSIP